MRLMKLNIEKLFVGAARKTLSLTMELVITLNMPTMVAKFGTRRISKATVLQLLEVTAS